MSEWHRVGDPDHPLQSWKTVLTQHEDDLYPVSAYKTDDGIWLRETEGPEDGFYGGGRHEQLYRCPTHWQPISDPPRVDGDRETEGV